MKFWKELKQTTNWLIRLLAVLMICCHSSESIWICKVNVLLYTTSTQTRTGSSSIPISIMNFDTFDMSNINHISYSIMFKMWLQGARSKWRVTINHIMRMFEYEICVGRQHVSRLQISLINIRKEDYVVFNISKGPTTDRTFRRMASGNWRDTVYRKLSWCLGKCYQRPGRQQHQNVSLIISID